MTSVMYYTPTLTLEDISGAVASGTSTRTEQSVRLPDLYQKFPGSPSRLVRYRIKVDTSYLAQSEVVAEVWSLHGVGWTELARIYVDKEFYTINGPDESALDPRTREITKTLSVGSKGAEYVAGSWQKIVNRIAAEAALVLEAVS